MANTAISQLSKKMSALPDQIHDAAMSVLEEYAHKILADATSGLPVALASDYVIERYETGVRIYTDNEIIAYMEFGTGPFASAYLSGQEQEVKDEAIKFYISGEGTMPEQPRLFPAFFRYRPEIVAAIDKEVQRLLDRI